MFIIHKYKIRQFFRYISSLSKSVMDKNNKKCIIAVCQMTSKNSKAKNFEIVKRLVSEAAQKKAKFVFLPEACDYLGNNKAEVNKLAETLDGPLMTQYCSLARTNKIWLSIGGFHEVVINYNGDKRLNNCHVIINDEGSIVSIYRKIHLFDVCIPERNIDLKESDFVIGGNEIVDPVESPAGPVGLGICYDLRFPEFSIILRKKGAAILTFPSAFTNNTGKVHWEVLLRARAIENQCYVIAAAQYGVHNDNRISYGQAMVVDPWGKILAESIKYTEGIPSNEAVIIAEIDSSSLGKIRTDMPVLEHRRNDIYSLIEISYKQISPDSRRVYMFADKIIPPSTVFYCTQHSYAFTNIRCVVPGHVLVSSIRAAKRLENLSKEEIADLFHTVVKVQKVMEEVHNSSSSTICVQDGPFAGQTIPHVHCHILPRRQGDFDRNDNVYQELANHDRENTSQTRSLDDMTQEAANLRKYFYNSH